MMCVQDTFAILGTLLVTEYWLGASYTSDMLGCEKWSLFLFRKPLLSRKAWTWRVWTWPDEMVRLLALPSAGVGSCCPPHWPWALSLFLSVSRPKFLLQLQPAGTRGTWKGFGDQVGQDVKEVETQILFSPKADRFCLSVTVLAFFGTKSSLQKWDLECPPDSEDMAF